MLDLAASCSPRCPSLLMSFAMSSANDSRRFSRLCRHYLSRHERLMAFHVVVERPCRDCTSERRPALSARRRVPPAPSGPSTARPCWTGSSRAPGPWGEGPPACPELSARSMRVRGPAGAHARVPADPARPGGGRRPRRPQRGRRRGSALFPCSGAARPGIAARLRFEIDGSGAGG